MKLFDISDSDQLSLFHRSWVEEALRVKERIRERRWSESIAVGTSLFVEQGQDRPWNKGSGQDHFEREWP